MIQIGNVIEILERSIAKHNYSKIVVLVDEQTGLHCLPLLAASKYYSNFIPIQISSGEENKTIATCEYIWDQFNQNHIDRNALLINLGGGVICDMGGFAASTYKRGIDFINIPTTLLAMVDASYGGKTGVNLNGIKNNIGVFQNAIETIIHPVFFQTLPYRELRSGWAEIIKHALIADKNYFEKIQSIPDIKNISENEWTEIIATSIHIKTNIVNQDPKEKGIRKILNFGHTIGHAIESAGMKTDYPLLHGEAIAIGMVMEAELSMKYCHLSIEEFTQIKFYIENLFGDIFENKWYLDSEHWNSFLGDDKKNSHAKILFSLIESIGKGNWDIVVIEF